MGPFSLEIHVEECGQEEFCKTIETAVGGRHLGGRHLELHLQISGYMVFALLYLVASKIFEIIFAIIVCCNVVMIGVQID